MKDEEVGIKYKKIMIDKDKYVLSPIGYESGYSVGDTFYSVDVYKIPNSIENIKDENVLIDSVMRIDELFSMYDYDDEEFVKSYYYEEERDSIILVETKDNKISKRKINVSRLMKHTGTEVLQRVNDELSVILNDSSLDNLISTDDIETIRGKLIRLKNKMRNFSVLEKKGIVTRVFVENGHVTEINTDYSVADGVNVNKIGTNPFKTDGISVKGLEQYIKERVFGHDEEIRMIAKTLIMNYTAEDNEKIEHILLVGPTGTGKTETMNAASEYLNIPYVEINAANLVPQGIKGESLEDSLMSLLVACEFDYERAQRALVFIDEIDKLGSDQTEYKAAVKSILLKYIEGGDFTVTQGLGEYKFNTKFLSKVFAGRFKELFTKNYPLGFGKESEESTDLTQLLSNKKYYEEELITRIKHIYLYDELDNNTKKRIILESKLSEYLLKKQRYLRQFMVDLHAENSYIEALLEKSDGDIPSMRIINNLISHSLEEAEYEMLSSNCQGKRLILTRDTVENNKNFKLL